MRQKVWRQFTCLSVAHGLMCAVLLPVMALQGSSSLWHHREQWLQIGPNIGSLLLSALFLLAAGMSLPSTRLIRRFGYAPLLVGNCLAVTLFLLSHLYASIYTLLPAYLLLGFTLSASNSCKAALIVHYGGRLSCSQHSECSTLVAAQQALTQQTGSDALHEEHKMFCNRDQKVRRLARWFRAAQDIGIIVGASLASLLLACNANDWSCSSSGSDWNATAPTNWPQPEDFYGRNEHGERICGADMCPLPEAAALPWITTNNNNNNNNSRSIFTDFIENGSRGGGQSMLWLYVLLSLVALLLSLLQGRQVGTTGGRQDRERDRDRDRDRTAKDVTETLLFAGPLSYFVGTEQGYMLGDFLRAFVSCSLGIGMIAGALIGMGLMQLIVSCTLSMLLRHTKRIVVICEYHIELSSSLP